MEPRAPNEPKAIASLVLGLASVLCFGPFTGVPAIALGALARRDVDRSSGARRGKGLAAAGITSGLFGTGLSLVLVLGMASGAIPIPFGPRTGQVADPAAVPVRVPVAAGTRSYGKLDVVDLDPERPLDEQLVEAARKSAHGERKLLMQTYVRSSHECAQIAASLPDKRMQRALEGVTLVRVDVEAFEDELRAYRVDTQSVPWFYALDALGRPMDALSADEWDDNVPENMAPVLGAFVRGELRNRRVPSPLGISL